MAGLTPEGFVVETLTEIRESMRREIWDNISATLDLSDRSFEGFLIGIVADRISSVWDLAQAVDSSADVDKAVDAQLDALAAQTGTLRREASYSTVTVTWVGDPGTFVDAGTGAEVPDGPRFDSIESATLVLLDDWVASTAYAVGDRFTTSGRCYQVAIAGTSGSSAPTSTSTVEDIVDGTAHLRFLGEGSAADDAAAKATETGPKVANAGTLIEIATPIGGLLSVTNLEDSLVGRDRMNNAQLRVLREQELAEPGTGTINAIRSALLQLDGVVSVAMFENVTDVTDGDGVPPHSVECMVQGGDDQEIWDTLLANVVFGIRTWGTEIGSSIDSEGNAHEMRFTRPDEIEIWIDITYTYDASAYPAGGDAAVAAAIAAYGQARPAGLDVFASALGARAFTATTGVLDVVSVKIGTAPSPSSSATIVINSRQLATYDTLRITVHSSAATP